MGGLDAELIKNRAIQGHPGSAIRNLGVCRSVRAASITIDTGNPLSPALPNVPRVTPTDNASIGEAGHLNIGC